MQRSVCKQSIGGTPKSWTASTRNSNREFGGFGSSPSSRARLSERLESSFSWCFGSRCLQVCKERKSAGCRPSAAISLTLHTHTRKALVTAHQNPSFSKNSENSPKYLDDFDWIPSCIHCFSFHNRCFSQQPAPISPIRSKKLYFMSVDSTPAESLSHRER